MYAFFFVGQLVLRAFVSIFNMIEVNFCSGLFGFTDQLMRWEFMQVGKPGAV